jgi:hypothetical protein
VEIAMSKILIAAGIGGTLPTLCRLAATYSVGNDPPPGVGIYIAIGLFAIIGMAVAFGFGESELKKAFVLGIAGPAIVTSTFNAVSQAKVNSNSTPPTAAAPHHDTVLGGVSLLFGIYEASATSTPAIRLAQTSPDSTSKSRQLAVVPNVSRAASGRLNDPIELQFFSDTGAVLHSTVIDSKFKSTVPVPAGARSVAAIIDGKGSTTKLPSSPFESARLNLKIDTSRTSEFLWALGSDRRVRVEGVSASLDNVIQPSPAVTPPTPIAAEPLQAGTTVYSQSGVPVGVVETVKPATAGEPAKIMIRAAESRSD